MCGDKSGIRRCTSGSDDSRAGHNSLGSATRCAQDSWCSPFRDWRMLERSDGAGSSGCKGATVETYDSLDVCASARLHSERRPGKGKALSRQRHIRCFCCLSACPMYRGRGWVRTRGHAGPPTRRHVSVNEMYSLPEILRSAATPAYKGRGVFPGASPRRTTAPKHGKEEL